MTSIHPELTGQFAVNDGVRLHYMAGGRGPLVVFIHGFPDFWYSWRHQLVGLIDEYRVVALDTRGFNRSDAPEGVENYSLDCLVSDVATVIAAEGANEAVIVGHDWGGATAWAFAQSRPELTAALVIVNVPHPGAMAAELQRPGSPQAAAFGYTADFRAKGSEANLDPESLASFVARDEAARRLYIEAFERSNFEAMMNYYRQNPAETRLAEAPSAPVDVPILQFHGLDDPTLLAASLNNTWRYVANTWTLVTIPGAGHWPHHDQPELVTEQLRQWLSSSKGVDPVAPELADVGGESGGCCG